jgi:tetratricopeptide (TPR) repeat protein
MMDHHALMAYGVGLRRRGQWSEAQQIIVEAATIAGRLGEFQHHARSFLELGILLLHSGDYQQAKDILSKAEATAKRYNRQDELEEIHLENAQFAIDLKDAEHALDILQKLPDSGRALALRAEAYLIFGSISDGLAAAMSASRYLAHDPTNLCRVQILIGRLRLAEGRYGIAEAYFSAAIAALEMQGDLFGLARARSNLGVALTHLQKFHRAKTHLRQAQVAQTILGDKLGLIVTQKNLDELQRLLGETH